MRGMSATSAMRAAWAACVVWGAACAVWSAAPAPAGESLAGKADLALTRDGGPVWPEAWTVIAGPDGAVQGVLNYARTYEIGESGLVWTGHQLDLYGADGAFVRTVATDSAGGYTSFVAVRDGEVYLGRADWADSSQDYIDRVVGGLSAENGTIEAVMPLVSNWEVGFDPAGAVYAMHNDGVNEIVRLDLASGLSRVVVEIGGYGAGFDFAPNGDLYFSTYGAAGGTDRILRLSAAQLAAGLPVDLAAAETVLELPEGLGGAGLAVDDAGNVVFAMNGGADNVLAAIYAGKDYSPLPAGYDVVAYGTTWLGNVEAIGDLADFRPGGSDNAAFTSGYFKAISYAPEPATACILAGALLAGLARRPRRRRA